MKKGNSGITLVALVITIILLMILAGVSIAALAGNNGLFAQVNKAEKQTNVSVILEKIKLEVLGSFDKNGYNVENAINNITNNLGYEVNRIDEDSKTLIVSHNGEEFRVDFNGEVNVLSGANVEDVFDSTGEIDNKLHIGDFINYTAGNWTASEIDKIGANNSTSLPSTNYQFGGFTEGSSKDYSATPYNESYNYVQETISDGVKQAVTGWRLFDVDMNKDEITLISAGCPEAYYNLSDGKDCFISEYILTGIINGRADKDELGLGTTYKTRDWSIYLNYLGDKNIGKAQFLSRDILANWYAKYIERQEAYGYIPDFHRIYEDKYKTQYESLIDNYSYYWLGSTYQTTDLLTYIDPEKKADGIYGTGALGIRVVVTLPASKVKISEESIGTKVITSRDVDYEYNVWDLK